MKLYIDIPDESLSPDQLRETLDIIKMQLLVTTPGKLAQGVSELYVSQCPAKEMEET
jgi:hypothetical protein